MFEYFTLDLLGILSEKEPMNKALPLLSTFPKYKTSEVFFENFPENDKYIYHASTFVRGNLIMHDKVFKTSGKDNAVYFSKSPSYFLRTIYEQRDNRVLIFFCQKQKIKKMKTKIRYVYSTYENWEKAKEAKRLMTSEGAEREIKFRELRLPYKIHIFETEETIHSIHPWLVQNKSFCFNEPELFVNEDVSIDVVDGFMYVDGLNGVIIFYKKGADGYWNRCAQIDWNDEEMVK